MIRQGDQFPLTFTIKDKDTFITPENCNDLKIKINSKTYKYSRGELTYINDKWQVYILQADTLNSGGTFKAEVQAKFSGNPGVIKSSGVATLTVDPSIITEEW